MGIVFRQSIKSTITTLAGALLGAAVIYLSRVYISKQELGLQNNLTNQTVASSQILLLGLHNTLAVYIHRYADGDRKKPVLLTITMLLPLFFIAGASALYFLLKPQILSQFQPFDVPYISRYFFWTPVFTLLFSYQVLLETYLISQLKVAKAIFMREIVLRILSIALILLFGFDLINFDAFVAGNVLIYIIPIAILWAIASKTTSWNFSFSWEVFTKAEKKDIIHFTWYHSLLAVSSTLMGYVDALMLAALSSVGLESVAVYILAVFLMSLLQIPYRAMLQATFPILAQAFAANDIEKVGDIFKRSSLNIFIASMAMWLLIVCNLHNAVAILPAGYEAVTMVVLILSAGRMIDLATGMNDQVLSMSKHYKINFYISILLVVLIIGLNWILIPRYDIYGAAWGTSAALIIFNILKYVIVKRKLGIQPFTKKTPLILLAGGITFIVGYFLPRLDNPIIDGLYRSIIIVVLYGGLTVWLKPSADIETYLQSIRQNKRLF